MPKTGGRLDARTVKQIRQIYAGILNKNKDLKAVVDAQLKGKTGKARVAARRRATKNLAKRNELFSNAAQEQLNKL